MGDLKIKTVGDVFVPLLLCEIKEKDFGYLFSEMIKFYAGKLYMHKKIVYLNEKEGKYSIFFSVVDGVITICFDEYLKCIAPSEYDLSRDENWEEIPCNSVPYSQKAKWERTDLMDLFEEYEREVFADGSYEALAYYLEVCFVQEIEIISLYDLLEDLEILEESLENIQEERKSFLDQEFGRGNVGDYDIISSTYQHYISILEKKIHDLLSTLIIESTEDTEELDSIISFLEKRNPEQEENYEVLAQLRDLKDYRKSLEVISKEES